MVQRSAGRLVLGRRGDAAASSSPGWRGWRQREPSYTVTGQQQERLGSSSWEEQRPLGGTVPSGRDVRGAGASGREAAGWSCLKIKAEEVGHRGGAEPLPRGCEANPTASKLGDTLGLQNAAHFL